MAANNDPNCEWSWLPERVRNGVASNLVGLQFGYLTVIERAENSKSHYTRWLCRCKCGKEVVVSRIALSEGQVSCGCRSKHLPSFASLKTRLRTYRNNAKNRGLPFALTEEEFVEVTSLPCSYCGKDDGPSGIDRIDNSIGYTVENCMPCCFTCNRAKDTMSYKEFVEWIRLVYQNTLK